jgi:hypothetical protein
MEQEHALEIIKFNEILHTLVKTRQQELNEKVA